MGLHAVAGARRAQAPTRDAWLLASCTACLLGIACLGQGPWIAAHARSLLGTLLAPASAGLASEAVVAFAVFVPATVAMGALFATLCSEAERAGHALGSALALNTLGAALAPTACSLLLLPAVGLRAALLVVALGYLPWLRSLPRARLLVPMLIGALALALVAPSPAHVSLPPGGRVLSYEQGVRASVSVLEDARGVRTLHIDDKVQEGSSATALVDGRQAWLPLLLHPAPQRALFLGLGTGVTAQSAARDGTLTVEAVELLPEVARASSLFRDASAREPHVVVADARRFARASTERFDVIVAVLVHPARAGAAALYTTEHFAALRERLAEGGLVCQWLPLHQLDLETLRSIVASFVSVYPTATALLASYGLDTPVVGLIGGKTGFRVADVSARVRSRAELAHAVHLEDALAVLGSFVAGPAALTRFATGAAPNTDDLPIVAYRAPWFSYASSEPPRARLLTLLSALQVAPGELVAEPEREPSFVARLAAYRSARDNFIALGARVRALEPDALLRAVAAPLLGLVRASPDFRPAYDPLLQMAAHLARSDVSGARDLLTALAAAQPARPEAAQLLGQLSPRSP